MIIHIFDFETTGVDPLQDRPVQVACLLANEGGAALPVVNTLCNPGMPITEEVSKLHGITYDMVKLSPAYSLAVWQMWATIGEDSPVLSGYNVSRYDIPMAKACCEPWFEFEVLDVLDVVYRRRPLLPNKKLGNVFQALLEREMIGAHGAMQDCIGTLAILNKICEQDNVSYRDLIEDHKTPRPYKIMPIGKYTGLPIEEVPASWASYMRSKATNMRPDLEATVNLLLS